MLSESFYVTSTQTVDLTPMVEDKAVAYTFATMVRLTSPKAFHFTIDGSDATISSTLVNAGGSVEVAPSKGVPVSLILAAGQSAGTINVSSINKYPGDRSSSEIAVTDTSAIEQVIAATRLVPTQMVLIFDDGYYNNWEIAAPILAKHGFSASLSLEVEDVDNEDGAGRPWVTADAMRSLIEDYGWEICNHPNLNLSADEDVMAADAAAENLQIVQLLTGELVWNGNDFVAGTLTYPKYSNYKINGAVYRGGARNTDSDNAYYSLYDKVRSINGDIGVSGNHLYITDQESEFTQHWSAIPADPSNNDAAFQRLLAFVRGCGSHKKTAIIYAHYTPQTAAEGDAEGIPYIHAAHLEELCRVCVESGVQLVPWSAIGAANLIYDSAFTNVNNGAFVAASGDTCEFDDGETLNESAHSILMTATAYRSSVNLTRYQTETFIVNPFTRYRVKIRYKIGTEMVLNGGPGNRNHGLEVGLITQTGNTDGTASSYINSYRLLQGDLAYNLPYESTGGDYAIHEMIMYTGNGHHASIALSLIQCTGTVNIGQIIVERMDSLNKRPLTVEATYNTTIGRYIQLMKPQVNGYRDWEWDVKVVSTDATSTVSHTVDYAFSDSADVPSPVNGTTCYVVGIGLGDFATRGGLLTTYNGSTWGSFTNTTKNSMINATISGEGYGNAYYHHHQHTVQGGQFTRLFSRAIIDRPFIRQTGISDFYIYNTSGTRTDTFKLVCTPVFVS